MDNLAHKLQEALASSTQGNGEFSLEGTLKELIRMEVEGGINAVLKAEMSAHMGYEKNAQGAAKELGNARNGFGKRCIQTAYGPVSVLSPRDRNGSFKTKLFEPYQRRTDNIAETVARLYSAGMTDSEISGFVAYLYDGKYSPSAISSMTDCIKEDVEAFRNSQLEPDWFAVFIDSIYVPLRRGTVEKEAINIAMGIGMDGERKVLGYSITPTESATEWSSLLGSLKKRGVENVRIIVSDGISGGSDVAARLFPRAKFQRCFVHMARNLGSKVRQEDKQLIMSEFMELAKKGSRKEAELSFLAFKAKWGAKYRSVKNWADGIDASEVFAFYAFDGSLRPKIYTNNCVEGFNKQIRRMLKKHIQFVTEEAMEKCLISIFLHYNLWPGKRPIKGREHLADELLAD